MAIMMLSSFLTFSSTALYWFFVPSALYIFPRSVLNFYQGECFVDYEFPFISFWLLVSDGFDSFWLTYEASPALRNIFSASCKDRPSSTSLLVSGLRFLMQLQVNLQNRGISHGFDNFWLTYEASPALRNIWSASCKDRLSRTSLLVSGRSFWCNCRQICKIEVSAMVSTVFGGRMKLHLPLGVFFLHCLKTSIPKRPYLSTESIFWCRKTHCRLPAMASAVFWLVYFGGLSLLMNFFLVCVRATPSEMFTVVGRLSFVLAWSQKPHWW